MDQSAINRALELAAHPISPVDPAHTWVEVAELVKSARTCTILSRCSGCGQEKWVSK